jgi:phospholipid/cholesterol/gamma-HCH transport system substrate-binding protein
VTRHYTQVDSSLSAIGRAGGNAEEAARNLATVSDDLKEITAKLNGGEGSAGRLLNDDSFINHVESTVSHLDSLIQDLKKHPGRYVKFSIF